MNERLGRYSFRSLNSLDMVVRRFGSNDNVSFVPKKTLIFFLNLKKTNHSFCLVWAMLRFLESRAEKGVTAPLDRLRSWLSALRIAEPDTASMTIQEPFHHFTFNKNYHLEGNRYVATLDELREDAMKKKLPTMTITNGSIEVNSEFVSSFNCDGTELDQILKESNGGFLPWGGDALARIIASERDLSLYIQVVSINMEQLGRPSSYPIDRVIPSVHVLNLISKGAVVRAIVRAVQVEHIQEKSFSYTTTLAFELPDETTTNTVISKIPQPISRVRTFTEAKLELSGYRLDSSPNKQVALDSAAADDDHNNNAELAENLEKIEESIMGANDDEWLSDLLAWASDETDSKASYDDDLKSVS